MSFSREKGGERDRSLLFAAWGVDKRRAADKLVMKKKKKKSRGTRFIFFSDMKRMAHNKKDRNIRMFVHVSNNFFFLSCLLKMGGGVLESKRESL